MMDMDRLFNAMSSRAAERADTQARAGWATVSSYDPATYTARVLYQPDNVLSGWLPIIAPNAGNGWGQVTGLTPGAQVFVVPQDGDGESNVILGSAYSVASAPPQAQSLPSPDNKAPKTPAQAGETMLVHQSGSVIRLCADGSIYLQGNVNVQGDLTVLGDVFDKHGSLDRLRGNYNTHVHSGVQAGTSNTGFTDNIDPEGSGTGGFA